MLLNTYNELVKTVQSGCTVINLVLESERLVDHMLPKGLASCGLSQFGSLSELLSSLSGQKEVRRPVIVYSWDGINQLSLVPPYTAGNEDEKDGKENDLDPDENTEAFPEAAPVGARLRLRPSHIGVHTGFLKENRRDKIDKILGALRQLDKRLQENAHPEKVVCLLKDMQMSPGFLRSLLIHGRTTKRVTLVVVTQEPIDDPRFTSSSATIIAERASKNEIFQMLRRELTEVYRRKKVQKVVLEQYGEVREVEVLEAAQKSAEALAGLHMSTAVRVYRLAFVGSLRRGEDGSYEIHLSLTDLANEKAAILNKAGYMSLIPHPPPEERLGGLENLKEWLHARKLGFTEEAKKAKLSIPRGVVLVGPPGTAKSLSAKICASIFGVPLIRLDIGALFNQMLGSSERNMRNALAVADASSPCLLWLDEIPG